MDISCAERSFALANHGAILQVGIETGKCHRADRDNGPDRAVKHVSVHGTDCLSYLHREIEDAPSGKEVIYLNHDTLDRHRANLKVVS